jgi:hypothetical protein
MALLMAIMPAIGIKQDRQTLDQTARLKTQHAGLQRLKVPG